MMQNSTYYFHYDFACKKVPLSLGYAKKNMYVLNLINETIFKRIELSKTTKKYINLILSVIIVQLWLLYY
jgi:hypothetical protein